MDVTESKLESSIEASNDITSEKDAVANLNNQIDELKRELDAVKKKLQKAEFERDSARKSVENLKSEVKELSKKLHEERKRNAEGTRKNGNAVQSINDSINDREYSTRPSQNREAQETEATETKDLRTALQEAATAAMSQSGFVYDDRTGLYYDWNTGYYYDPTSRLYYENTTGIYYYYDEQSGTYKLHSRVDISSSKQKTARKDSTEEKESGEESSEDEAESDKEIEVTEVQFPCIRAIVTKSSKLKAGSLFIVTYIGGTIGREKNVSHVIRIPDVEVSKVQCNIEFDKERRQFFISDVGSRNGTFLNGCRLSESKQESKPQVITHGDELTLGSTSLRLHIHPGSQTCDSCEPGQVQAQAQQETLFVHDDEVCITKVVEGRKPGNSLTIQEQRKSVLKRIKKAYALEESSYTEPAVDVTGKYKDRAEVRRTKVGSDVPVVIADDAPASVHRPISTDNVGRQMLEKMGWSEGEGLGREGAGRREPVIVEVRDSLRGLGTGVKRSLDDAEGKSYARAKTRERFTQAAQVTNDTTKRFVAAKTVHDEEKTSHNKDTDDVISLVEKTESTNDSTQSNKADKEESLDMFSA